MRRVLGLAGAVLAMLVGAVVFAAPASAHATLVFSDPPDSARLERVPDRITLRFDEPVGLDPGFVKVVDSSGERVDTGTPDHPGGQGESVSVSLRSGLGDESYVVSFRLVSADAHPIAGSYPFVVGDGPLAATTDSASPGASVSPVVDGLFTATRWAGYAGLALLVGGAAFLVLAWPEGTGGSRPRRMVWAGWGLVAGSTVAGILLQGPYAAGAGVGGIADPALLRSTLHTTYGRMLSTRLILLAVLVPLVKAVLDQRAAERGERRWPADAGAVAALGVFVTVAASGHAATGIAPPLSVLATTAHLAAMSLWLGGLAMMLACLLPAPDRAREAAVALPVFSRIAVGSVAALVVSGGYQVWREVGTLPALWSTTYGELLLAKLAGFVLLVGLGYTSHAVIRRRYVRPVAYALSEVADHPADERSALTRMRRSVVVETAVALVVLALTAVLVERAPARAAFINPFETTLRLDDGDTVVMDLTPAKQGSNEIHLFLYDENNNPFDPRDLSVSASLPQEELGPLQVDLVHAGVGHYIGTGLSLPSPGEWRVSVSVRTSEFDESDAEARVPLS